MSFAIHSPVLPFVGPIGGRMQPGSKIRVLGTVPNSADRFSVNLKCGPSERNDVALSLFVHLRHGTVVRNTLVDMCWGIPETFGHIPFKRGMAFELVFLCHRDHFKVLVNGQDFVEYIHRTSFERVNHLEIKEDVLITFIQFEGFILPPGSLVQLPEASIKASSMSAPSYPAHDASPSNSPPATKHELQSSPFVFAGRIGKMQAGWKVKILGTVPQSAKRFSVNLKCGANDKNDVALHLLTCFQTNQVERNTMVDMYWGPEETFGDMPFRKGVGFELVILCDDDHFKILVNGKHFVNYIHRVPYEGVTDLEILDDVTITSIWLEGGLNDSKFILPPRQNQAVTDKGQNGQVPSRPPPPLGQQPKSLASRPIQFSGPIENMGHWWRTRIVGTVPAAANRFVVSFKCAPYDDSDVALQILVCFQLNKVILNTMIRMCWGAKEIVNDMPFLKGVMFEMGVLASPSHFKISVNGNDIAEYMFRVPYVRINHLNIEEDVVLKGIWLEGSGKPGRYLFPPKEMVISIPAQIKGPASKESLCPISSDSLKGMSTQNLYQQSSLAPYFEPIQGKMEPGWKVTISGFPYPTAHWFVVNLRSGAHDSGDIPVHLSVRFPDDVVVRNTWTNRRWGEEERAGRFPFTKCVVFEMVLLCAKDHFQILVDGKEFAKYAHRIPYSRITHLQIRQDVYITAIKWGKHEEDPTCVIRGPTGLEPPPVKMSLTTQCRRPNFDAPKLVPYFKPIEGKMEPGWNVTVAGAAIPAADRFVVNLSCGPRDSSDIPLHLSIRFPQAAVVRNTWTNNRWGDEETFGGIPFKIGVPFEMVLLCTEDHFQITVDGKQFANYKHRIPYYRITHLQIKQDVNITSVQWGSSAEDSIPGQGAPPAIKSSSTASEKKSDFNAHNSLGAPTVFQIGAPTIYQPFTSSLYHSPYESSRLLLEETKTAMNEFHESESEGDFYNDTTHSADLIPEVMATYHSPPMPFVCPFYGSVEPGKMVRIQGKVRTFAQRFNINLKCGPYASDDIALHLSVRFPEVTVVRNSLINMSWGEEERFGGMPFSKGADFDMIILCERDHFKIAVNGQHFVDYFHETPFKRITYLEVKGNVTLNRVQWEKGFNGGYKSAVSGQQAPLLCWPPAAPVEIVADYFEPVHENPLVPFLCPIGYLRPGKRARIQGRVPKFAERFDVNLKCGPYEDDDIALHLSVRFLEDAVVRNRFINKSWGTEQRFGRMPFTRGAKFLLLILCEHDRFEISVNGQHYVEYLHETAFKRVTYVEVKRDVVLNNIDWEETFGRDEPAVLGLDTPSSELLAGWLSPPPYDATPGSPGYLPVPFVCPIGGNLQAQRMVIIQGKVPKFANRFDINLRCGPHDSDDIALHMSVRFSEDTIVRNSLIDLQWGVEERAGGMPFLRGAEFELLVLCEDHHFKIAVDKQHYAKYLHRTKCKRVTYLQVTGNVELTKVRWVTVPSSGGDTTASGHQLPTWWPPPPPYDIASSYLLPPQGDLPVPFLCPIGGNLKAGRMVMIKGAVPRFADRFDVNLKCGPYGNDDIALHISVRFLEGDVVRNSLINQSWGIEERFGGMPFSEGADFSLMISCETDRFKVAVNDKHFVEYVRDTPYRRVSYLEVKGDVVLTKVEWDSGRSGRWLEAMVPNWMPPPPYDNGLPPPGYSVLSPY